MSGPPDVPESRGPEVKLSRSQGVHQFRHPDVEEAPGVWTNIQVFTFQTMELAIDSIMNEIF